MGDIHFPDDFVKISIGISMSFVLLFIQRVKLSLMGRHLLLVLCAYCCLYMLLGAASGAYAQSPTSIQTLLPDAPSEYESGKESRNSGKSIRLIFVGDIMVHATQLEIAQSKGMYDFHPSFAAIRPWLNGDLVIGNFETVLGGAKLGFSGYPRFNSPDSLAAALRDVGFTTLFLANNHIYDHGIQAAKRTVDVLQTNNLSVTGLTGVCHSPLLIDVKGVRIGFFNYTYGSNAPVKYHNTASTSLNIIDKCRIVEDITSLRRQGADYIVATFHWGEEYTTEPSRAQRDIANYCLELGVDAIIGTHPHVLQPIEVQRAGNKDCVIAWSLGNFISSQRTLPRERSAILALDILPATGGAYLHRVSVAPTWVDLSRPRKVARVLPAVTGFFSPSASDQQVTYLDVQKSDSPNKISPISVEKNIASKLFDVELSIRTFWDLPTFPDEQGFYSIYEYERNELLLSK